MKKKLIIFLIITVLSFYFTPLLRAYTLEVDYPVISGESATTNLAQYIRYLYLSALSLVGLAAFGALVYGGFQYLLSAGSVGSSEEAKKWIWGAIYGLILALAAVLILRTINPDLINLEYPTLPNIQTPATQTPSSSALPAYTYQWMEISDCIHVSVGGVCFSDSYCSSSPKPGPDYCCCGQ